MVLPLTARGRALGAVTLIAGEEPFDLRSVDHAMLMVQRIAVATDNARLYEEAQRAVRLREDTVAIVSHDLRSPLTAMKFSVQRLRKKITPDANPDTLEILNRMDGSLSAAITLLGDLLDFARIEAGHFSVVLAPVPPEALVQSVLTDLQSQAEAAGMQLAYEKPAVCPLPLVNADAGRMGQVLANLIRNAIRFSGPAGRITVRNDCPSPSVVRFVVEDHGEGMSAEVLSHLFERYYQSPRTARQGIGLGLSISKGIVQAHGGEIWAESAEGSGSRFFFTLRCAPKTR